MKHAIALLPCILFFSTPSQGQGNHVMPNSTRFRWMDSGGGNSLLAVERRFGFDSSYVELLQSDAAYSSTGLSSYRFPYGLYFLFDAVQLPSGPLISGLFPNASVASLCKLNNDGTLDWSKSITGMIGSQRRFVKLFPDAFGFVGYSNSDGFFGDLFYRVQGNEDGTVLSATVIATGDTVPFRIYEGCGTATPGKHMLVGARFDAGDYQALVARIDASGPEWINSYELGGGSGETEEAIYIAPLDDGNYAVAMNKVTTAVADRQAFISRMTPSGSLDWTVRLSDPIGISLSTITELDDGSLLATGYTSAFLPRIVKLSPTGTLLWVKECASCSFNIINDLERTSGGELIGLSNTTVYRFASDGSACGFDDVNTVSAIAVSLVGGVLPSSSGGATLTEAPASMSARTPVNALSQNCVWNSVQDVGRGEQVLIAYPDPTSGPVYVSGSDHVRGATYRVRSMTGQVMGQGRYMDGIDLSALASGIYLIDFPELYRRVRVLRE